MDLSQKPHLQRIIDAWNSGGPDQLIGLASDFIVYEHMGNNYLVARGAGQFGEYMKSLFKAIQNLHFDFTNYAWNDPSFFLEWIAKGNLVGNRYGVEGKGEPIRFEGVSVVILEADGKIVEHRSYFNDKQIVNSVKFPDRDEIE
ncbi:MAG: ester cyclase [Candidatus Thermoplasmatota archaeon]|jgi:steroid delta-isomerase-like uncharacterized protein|nr:ester cyclase [Candidatus Thermoplasmatota archaeon]